MPKSSGLECATRFEVFGLGVSIRLYRLGLCQFGSAMAGLST